MYATKIKFTKMNNTTLENIRKSLDSFVEKVDERGCWVIQKESQNSASKDQEILVMGHVLGNLNNSIKTALEESNAKKYLRISKNTKYIPYIKS